MFILKTGHQPGVCVPLRALFLVCSCTVWFVSDLVGNLKDWFSHNEAHLSLVARKPVLDTSHRCYITITHLCNILHFFTAVKLVICDEKL